MGDMGNTTPGLFRRRWFQCLWLLILILASLVGYKVWDRFWPHSYQVTISPETTVLTGPLDADGLVDYTAAIDQEDAKGVTPENNAAVLLVQILPDRDWQAMPPELLRKIGAPTSRPADAPRFVPLDEDFLASLPQEMVPTTMPADDPPIPGRPVKPTPPPPPAPAPPPMGPGPGLLMGPDFGPGPGLSPPSPTPEPTTEPSTEPASGPTEGFVAPPPMPDPGGPRPMPVPPGPPPGFGPGPGPGGFPIPIGPGFGPGFSPWTPPPPPPPTAGDMLRKQFDLASKRPWTAKEFPAQARWLQKNAPVIPVLHEASRRTRLFVQSCGWSWNEVPVLRVASKLLVMHALLAAGESRWDAAREDLLSLHRIARLARAAGTFGGSLGLELEDDAAAATSSILAYCDVGTQGSAWLKDHDALPEFSDSARTVKEARYMALDFLARSAKFGFAKASEQSWPWDDRPRDGFPRVRRDWDADLRTCNQWMDRVAAISKGVDFPKAQSEFRKIESELTSLTRSPGSSGSGRFSSELAPLLHHPAEKIVRMQMYGVQQDYRNYCIAWMRFQINRMGLALAAYHADTGKWPATLDELAPKYVKDIPPDCFTGQPLVYRADEGGYILYSLGVGGIDRGGDEDGGNIAVFHRTTERTHRRSENFRTR